MLIRVLESIILNFNNNKILLGQDLIFFDLFKKPIVKLTKVTFAIILRGILNMQLQHFVILLPKLQDRIRRMLKRINEHLFEIRKFQKSGLVLLLHIIEVDLNLATGLVDRSFVIFDIRLKLLPGFFCLKINNITLIAFLLILDLL